MKICKLQGGLGNQMFQYAATRALEKKKSKNICLDHSFLREHAVSTETFTARVFELDIFKNLRAEEYDAAKKRFFYTRGFFTRKYRKMFSLGLVEVEQKGNGLVEIPSARNLYLNGYFQSEKYFKSIRADLLNDFAFPALDAENRDLKEKMESENSVSIHIRRGDYVTNKAAAEHHGVFTPEYYMQALSLMKSSAQGELTYYIFSDDPEFVSNNYSFLPEYTLVNSNKGRDSWKDMALMKACKNHIVANSSFSWWGAWLSERDGINIAPANWYSAQVSFNIHDYIPDNWLII